METLLLLPVFLLVGFVGGSFLTIQLMRWGLLIRASLTQHGGDFLGAPRRRLLWAFPFVALFHPAPYLLAAVVLALYRMFQGTVRVPFIWLLLGFTAYMAVVGLTSLRVFRLRRRQRLAKPRT